MRTNTAGIDAIIVAAGSGTRLGHSIPKAFVPISGKPMLSYSIDSFLSHEQICSVILVVPGSMYEEAIAIYTHTKIKVVTGGEQRWQSVENGVSVSTADYVMIHDAARPFVNHTVIDKIIEKLSDFECVITVTPEVDTIRIRDGEKAGITIDRDSLIRVGTPQLFRRELLCKGLSEAARLFINPTDEAVLMQNMGITVGIAWGDPKNFKVTTPSDLEIAEALIEKDQKMLLGR
jgi:2-C-methyl-D-erythritol 4-phosphate cytidylyltransferase